MRSPIMKNLQSLDLLPILALASLFIRISGSLSLRPVLTGPDKAYLGSRVAFRCIAPDSSLPVTYKLTRDSSVLVATVTNLQVDQTASFFLKVTVSLEGSYNCKATTRGSTGVSNSIALSVVTPPSNTRVTSEPFPPAAYEGSSIVLSCSVAKGSNLFYTWFFNRKELTSSTSPLLLLTGNKLVMGKVTPEQAGYYYCMAWSRVQDIRRFSSSSEVQVTVKVYVSKPRISFSVSKEGNSPGGNVTCWSARGSPPVNISLSVDDKEVGSVTAPQSLVAWFPTKDCSSRMLASLFVVILGLCFCSNGSSQSILGRPEVIGPSEALVKSVVDFKCELTIYPENETILLQLFKEDNRNKLLGEYTSLNGEVAIMPMVIDLYHEGSLECVAKAQNNSKIEPTVSYTHYLKVIEPVKGAQIDVQSGPVDFFEGKSLELHCDVIAGNHVSYKWLLNSQLVSQSPRHYAADGKLLINRTTSKDSGSYICVATNHFNQTDTFTSNSSEVMITVKDLVSIPDISFIVLKEDTQNYSAEVTCQSTKGTPPVTFSLYNRTELVANITIEERIAAFKVPLVLGQHLGCLQCQANNGDQIEYSQWIPLEVVPVGGPVIMHYDYDVGENYAIIGLRFYCKAAKGSLPRYQWFLNKTLLHDRGSFYYVVNQPPEQSILLLSVGRSGVGTYHCEVSDSFDNTSSISSDELYLDKEVLNRLPVSVVAVVLGCFTFLVVLVYICCLVGAMFRRRPNEGKSTLSLEMNVNACKGKLDSSEYNENADLVETTRGDAFDLASETSVDEWPDIEKEKKTLQDEP
ncbi:Fc receptor-like protein 5 [Clinocottus analis]|uniref:Fc receptor-like protein 5 n=1 Tax=Clinocottus analis TaxID=304258 RepID=UPI0035C1E527